LPEPRGQVVEITNEGRAKNERWCDFKENEDAEGCILPSPEIRGTPEQTEVAMKRRPFAAVCVAWGLLFALSAAAQAPDPNVGSWRVELSKSKYNPPNLAPKSGMVKSSASGKGLNVVVDVVDNTGKPLHYEYTVTYDGQDAKVKGDPNRDTTAMKKIDDLTFEQTNKKDGKVTTVSRLVYAKDGKSRTQTTTGTNPQGQKIDNTVVWIKQ
jgi:hypothetical protein